MKEYRQIAGHTPSAVPSFLLGTGPGRQMYTLIDSYCEEPECKAGEGQLLLQPERDPEQGLTFWFNFYEGAVRMDRDPGKEASGIIDLFLDQYQDLLVRRRQVVRAWGLTKLHRKKDYEPALTYSFQDFAVVKENFAMPFHHEGKKWGVVDMYCVNPDCPCNESLLQFIALWKAEGNSPSQPEAVLVIDLKTGTTSRPGRSTFPLPDPALLASFQETLGDWCGELMFRRGLLRRVARKRLRFRDDDLPEEQVSDPSGDDLTVPLLPPSIAPPISSILFPGPPPPASGGGSARSTAGRNDPCPCGSGKKYKKCCGR